MSGNLFLRGVILLGFALLMFKFIVTGQIQQLIAPKMLPFLYFAMITLFMLSIIQIWRSDNKHMVCCGCGHHKSNARFQSFVVYVIFVFPVLAGFTFSNHVLDSSVAAKRGIQLGGMAGSGTASDNEEEFFSQLFGNQIEEVPMEKGEKVDKNQLGKALLAADKVVFTRENYLAALEIVHNNAENFIGKEVELTGFVYREPDFAKEKAVIARFGISCCVADASVYGMLVSGKHLKSIVNDEWVKVIGVIKQTNYKGNVFPCIEIKEINKIQQPNEPYIYEDLL
ncbi:putative repeat protein (TIGR03943 family) [Anoxybacillus vitaminiphilus]|uniref:Putative repeat protein (TIGR03943 family) n=1 Tax=Paranoxybacillus vitaminiphilus TaxID=581036 RepID=A0A327YJC1_9BACL|nr:TIGR03943 family protein [Anoxybacillus vitaminiphilus]RAK21094.1 putative repeat protein (TIGR03943 family) [Anoxybacillus vitaminiphilus]